MRKVIHNATLATGQIPCGGGVLDGTPANESIGEDLTPAAIACGWRYMCEAAPIEHEKSTGWVDDGLCLTQYRIPYTAEEIADQQAQAEAQRTADAQAEAVRAATIEAMREQYRQITRTICQLAGVAVCDKFATVGGVADVVMQYGMGENVIPLTQYALFLKATLDELRRFDGDDAWERI